MTARIIVVHAKTDFLAEALSALRQTGFEVSGFSNPLDALNAFDANEDIELLITGISYGPGKQNGISLALMEKTRRRDLKVLFAASPEYQGQDDGIGEFLPLPLRGDELVKAVQRLLSMPQQKMIVESKQAGGRRTSIMPTLLTSHRRRF